MTSRKSSDEPEHPTIKVVDTGDELPGPDRPEPNKDSLIVGRYRVTRRIGKGGMGEVMLARDEQLGRDVAIKRMRAANPSERAIQRFLREATVQGRLEHPAILPVHEIGRDTDGLPFFVMKKLAGESLAQLLEKKDALPLQRSLRAFSEVCIAMEFAHVRGIVHRDLKPDNIMLGDFGEMYIVDWGVAKIVGEEDGDFADVGSGSGGHHATGTGVAIGTPGYMAPEQVKGAPDLDGRADVYTLGCLLFELLAGEPLHPRGHAGLRSALDGVDARPSARASSAEREVPPELEELCVLATKSERGERIATARELGERVQAYLDGDRDVAMRRQLARKHLDAARSAFSGGGAGGAGGGDDGSRLAMREAAAAIALDPELAGAAELVGRLMLEPPREMPVEVTTAIADQDVRDARAVAKAGLWTVLGGFVMLPLLWWISPPDSNAVPILAAMLAVNGLFAWYAKTAPIPKPGLVALANTITVVALARFFSPVFIAPGIAASLGMAMVLTPRFSWLGSAVTISVLMVGAVLGPLLLEIVGVLSRTMAVDARGIVLRASAVGTNEGPAIAVAALYAGALITTACIAAAGMRAATRRAHLHLQLQAWQLRQLVPGT